MTFTISIELMSGTYDAGEAGDRARAEWPPHPARLFCALVASARDETDRTALRWLEQQAAPVVTASGGRTESQHSSYVVVNSVSQKGGNQTHPGRTNGLRTRARELPADPRVMMTWPTDPAPQMLDALDGMAQRIPYLGRSTGIALVTASAESAVPAIDGRVAYEPCELQDQKLSLRVPYPGFLNELDNQFAIDRPAWEVSRYQGYRPRDRASSAPVEERLVPSVYPDVLVFQFSGLRPQPQLTARFAEAFKAAVLHVAGDTAPAALHGHGADGRPHVAFLALPDVGHQHADGHLLGMAVAIPELPEDERRSVIRAVLGLRSAEHEGVIALRVPGIGTVELIYSPGLVRPWGASEERWRKGSRRWSTATPLVLDRYPKRPEQIESHIRSALRTVGLPEPLIVETSKQPLQRGAAQLRPGDLPTRAKGRLYRHVAVTFDRPVSGPVLVGAGRYLGVGLFAPLKDSDV